MSQSESVFDAISALEESSNRVLRYVSDELNVTAEPLKKTLEEWKEFQSESKGKEIKAYGPLLVEPGFRPLQGKAVSEVECLHETTKQILNWGERSAYEHQIESWNASIQEKKTLIVSAGTGSGKTECFNVPILDALIREGAEKGILGSGVRALIVYPLNALVNDQMSRWRSWLKRQEDILPEARRIKVATFNSRLKETNNQGKEQIQKKKKLLEGFEERIQNDFLPAEPHELISRDQLRANPPHILITNYSMLEYMLLRPQDDAIFEQSLGQLKFIVLDEAHTYSAGMAGDIALLLRRSMQRFAVEPHEIQGFATSATFGTSDREGLRKFVADLFSQVLDQVSIIYGKTTTSLLEYQHTIPTQSSLLWHKAQALSDLISQHGHNANFWQEGGKLCSAIQSFGIPYTPPTSEKSWEIALKDSLAQCWEFTQLLDALTEKEEPLRLSQLQQKFQERLEAQFQASWDSGELEIGVMTLLRLGALAKNEDGHTLQPVRLHAVSRGMADGFHVCLNPECTEMQKHPERAFSKKNQSEFQSGILRVGEAGKCACKSLTFPLWNCRECGSIYGVAQAEHENEGVFFEIPQEKRAKSSLFLLYTPIEIQNREYTENSDIQATLGNIELKDFLEEETLTKVPCWSVSPVKEQNTMPYWDATSSIWKKEKNKKLQLQCPCCGEKREYHGITTISNRTSRLPMLSGVLQKIPNRSEQVENVTEKRRELPGHGKNLLTFSDSRQEAARLAPLFADTHNRYLFAAACLTVLKQYQGEPESVQNDIQKELQEKQEQMKTAEAYTLKKLKRDISNLKSDLEEVKGGVLLKDIAQELTEIPWVSQLRMAESIGDDIKNEALKKQLSFRLMQEYMGSSPVNLENLGLIEFIYPKLNSFDPPKLTQLGFAVESSRLLLRAYLDLFRRRCSVRATLGKVFVSWKDRSEFPQYFRLNGAESYGIPEEGEKFTSSGDALKAEIKAWPTKMKNSSVFKIAQKFKKSLNSDLDDQKLIFAAWEDIGYFAKQNGHLKEILFGKNENHAYQIVPDDCILKLSSQLFQCKRCHALSSVNFFGQCKKHKCSGELEDLGVTSFEILEEITRNRSGRAFRIWDLIQDPVGYRTMEHTAQRGVENLEIEEIFFRRGERNLMSSSTTLELGVDIGDLSAVFMNNTPPQSKNYKQRAGRAGRSGQGMALSLTLAGNAPQDHWFYRDPERFLDQRYHLPWVLLNSRPLVQRQVNAVIFSLFYRQANLRNESGPQRSYGKLINFIKPLEKQGDLFSQNVLASLKEMFPNQPFGNQTKLYEAFLFFLEHPPTEKLEEELKLLIRGTVLEEEALEKLLEDLKDKFQEKNAMILKVERELAQLEKEKSHATHRFLGLIQRQISNLENQNLVNFLAKQGIIPRYGFPLDVIKLDEVCVGNQDSEKEIGSMERNLALAIWEYAPGNEVTFNGRSFTVKGISASPYTTGSGQGSTLWETIYYQRCPACYRVETSSSSFSQLEECPHCKEKLKVSKYKASYIQPHGFRVDPNDEGHRVTQHTQFRSPNTYALPGNLPVAEAWDHIGELEISYDDHFELLNLNQGYPVYGNDSSQDRLGFHVCTGCGVAERAKSLDPHASILGPKHLQDFRTHKKCTGSSYNRNISFGVHFRSEALFLKFKESSRFAGSEAQKTAAQVFRLAATKLMALDVRNLEAHITQDEGAIVLILFETQEGGSGILSLLRNRLGEWLELAVELANEECSNPSCEIHRSCPECLLTFDTQRDKELITRKAAREIFGDSFKKLYCNNSYYEETFGSNYQILYAGFAELMRELRRAEKITLVFSDPQIWEKHEIQLQSLLKYRTEQGLVEESTQIIASPEFYEQFQSSFVWASFAGVQCFLSTQNYDFPLTALCDESTPYVMTHDFNLPVMSKKVGAISCTDLKLWKSNASEVLKINESQKWTTSKILKHFIGTCKVLRALYSDRFVWAGTKNRDQFQKLCQSIPWKNDTLNMLLITQQELHDYKGGWHITEELQANGTVLRYHKKREMDHPRLMYFELDNGEYCYLASDQGLEHMCLDDGEEDTWKSTHILRFDELPYQDTKEIAQWIAGKTMKQL